MHTQQTNGKSNTPFHWFPWPEREEKAKKSIEEFL